MTGGGEADATGTEAPAAEVTDKDAPQDWGPPSVDAAKMEAYWVAKREAPAAPTAPSIPLPPGSPTPSAPAAGAVATTAKSGSGRGTIAALIVLVAGLAAAAASMIPWVSTAATSKKVVCLVATTRGMEFVLGKAVPVLGALAVIFALLWFIRREAGPLKAAIPVGIAELAIGVFALLTIEGAVIGECADVLGVAGVSESAARGQITGWIEGGMMTVSVQNGVYLLIGAAVLTIVGGVLALGVRSSRPAKFAPPDAGWGA